MQTEDIDIDNKYLTQTSFWKLWENKSNDFIFSGK